MRGDTMSDYIIKNSDSIKSYYFKNNKIFLKEYKKGNWSSEIPIADNVRPNFSISDGRQNIIFYQQLTGDICTLENNGKSRIILKHTGSNVPDIIINSIIDDNMRLIYNIVDEKGINRLVYQHRTVDKKWSDHDIIDIFEPTFAKVAEIEKGRYILIYSRRKPEIQFGYRELNLNSAGSFKMLYATSNVVTDFSYVVTNEILHFIFVQSSGFLNRVIYVKKDSTGLSAPKTIYEGFNIKKCLVGIISDRVYVWWSCGRILYCTNSYDNGQTFMRPTTENNFNGMFIKKSDFRDYSNSNRNDYIFNEIMSEGDRFINQF